jgi:hypothetical protein
MRRLVGAIIVISLIALLVWGFLQGRKESAAERELDQPVKAPARVSEQDGSAVVRLDAAALSHGGIRVEALPGSKRRARLRAFGRVVEVQPLSDLRVNLTKARAAASESQRDVVRQQTLFAQGQGVSKEAVQEAEAKARAEGAVVQGFVAQAQEEWGSVIGDWIANDAPELQTLLQLKTLLLLVSLPSGVAAPSPPAEALIESTSGKTTSAQFVSAALRTDPRLQGASFFYTTAAQGSDLLPGMNVTLFLPIGPEKTGVVVPAAAAVWWQGKAWVYVETRPQEFQRRGVETDFPVEHGWFVTSDLAAGERVVTRGAQLLLSEEFRDQIEKPGD